MGDCDIQLTPTKIDLQDGCLFNDHSQMLYLDEMPS